MTRNPSTVLVHRDRSIQGDASRGARNIFDLSRYCAEPILRALQLPNPATEYHIFLTPDTTFSGQGQVSYVSSGGEVILNSRYLDTALVSGARVVSVCEDYTTAHEWAHRIRPLKAISGVLYSYNGYARLFEEGLAELLGKDFSVRSAFLSPTAIQTEDLDLARLRQVSRAWSDCRQNGSDLCPLGEDQCCNENYPGLPGPRGSIIDGVIGNVGISRGAYSIGYYLETQAGDTGSQEVLVLALRQYYYEGRSEHELSYLYFPLNSHTCEEVNPDAQPLKSVCLTSVDSSRVGVSYYSEALPLRELECEPTQARFYSYVNLGHSQIGIRRSAYYPFHERERFYYSYFYGTCFWREIENRYGFDGLTRIVHETQRIGEETRVCRQINYAQMFASALRVREEEIDEILSRYFPDPDYYRVQYLLPICR